MAIVHRTTLVPGKLELLAAWLPAQPWYLDRGREPELAKTGGFRLDDPQGEVGIEFMVVTDGSGDQASTYLVPLTYRGSALAGDDGGLVGTTEHGVLGRRWVYDGTSDPVLVAQLVALIKGEAEPQAQGISNTPDPTVEAVGPDGALGDGELIVRVNRILKPDGDVVTGGETGQPCLFATWRRPDGTPVRGVLATARYALA